MVVWICNSGFPIEYYDEKVLFFVGNWVGRVVQVDKNTLQLEREKYATLYVEVNLSKPLLEMFTVIGRK